MAKRVVVTGAGGYIGRHVVNMLLDNGNSVGAVDLHYDGVDERADRLSIDIFSGSENIYDELGRPDVVLHMAWRDGFRHNSFSHIDDLPHHFHLIQNLVAGGLPQIAVMGTMHEVGYWEGAITAESPCNPASRYGVAKNALRQLTSEICSQHEAKMQWIRAFYIVGDDSRGNSIFSKLLAAANSGKKTFPFTSGKNYYDFISITELANQISAVVSQDEITGIINACSGKPVTLAERVENYISEHNLDISLEYGAFPDRPYDSPGVWGDPTLIEKILKNK